MGDLVTNDHANGAEVEVPGPASLEEWWLQYASRESLGKCSFYTRNAFYMCSTYGVVVGRVPGVDNGGVHEPDVSAGLLPQGDHVLLGGPGLHAQQLVEVVREVNVGISR